MSRRAIENLFQDFLGVTPANYLKRQRLHGVRRALQNKPGTPGVVKETALHWGFWHMGHFTHDYQGIVRRAAESNGPEVKPETDG